MFAMLFWSWLLSNQKEFIHKFSQSSDQLLLFKTWMLVPMQLLNNQMNVGIREWKYSYVDVLLSSLWRSLSLLSRLFIISEVLCRHSARHPITPWAQRLSGPHCCPCHHSMDGIRSTPPMPLTHFCHFIFYCNFFVLSLKPLHYHNLSQNHFCYTAITI